jgi:hypothetical protein
MLLGLTLLWASSALGGEGFLGAPVIPGGKILVQTESRLEIQVPLSHDAAVAFYREMLKGQPDIRFRDWKEATYIEDDGKLPWHSITLSKGDRDETLVVIVRDNWTWIIGTLVIRFIGVFTILIVLFFGMTLSGAVISRFVRQMEEKQATPKP